MQAEKLLDSIADIEEKSLIMLAISAGIRRSDIVAIKSADVNLDRGEVTFYENKKRRTKTVQISPRTATVIEMWLKINKSHWLFPSKFKNNKQHLSSRSAYNMLRNNTRKAGLPDIPFHALRATCAKLCQKNGWTITQTAKLLGDNESTVQKHYTVPSVEEMKQLAEEKPVI